MTEVLHEEELTEMLEELLRQLAEILPALRELLDEHERPGDVVVDDGVAESEERVLLDGRPELEHVLRGDLLARRGGELVERRDRVAERPAGATRDERERGVGRIDSLPRADRAKDGDDLLEPRSLEGERLAAGADGRDHLRLLGRAENEDEVGRWLLDQLQERVPGRRRELMRLVDDVDLVAALRRLEHRALADLADLVDSALRGGIHLHDVERGAVGDRASDARRRVEVGAGATLGVQRLRENPRHRRLPRPARPGEEVRLPHLVGLDRIPQRADDSLLARRPA